MSTGRRPEPRWRTLLAAGLLAVAAGCPADGKSSPDGGPDASAKDGGADADAGPKTVAPRHDPAPVTVKEWISTSP